MNILLVKTANKTFNLKLKMELLPPESSPRIETEANTIPKQNSVITPKRTFVEVSLLTPILGKIKQIFVQTKQSNCLEVWRQLCSNGIQSKVTIDDNLWSNVKQSFSPELSSSLIKFLSSYICQTGSFEVEKDYFVFHLYSAAEQQKFFLDQTLIR